MNGFIESFAPLLIRLRKYFLEIILLTMALIITIAALTIYAKNAQENADQEIEASQIFPISPTKIFVDVSGAVKKSNVYEMDFGARLKNVVDKAGGLSDEADMVFFNRNFNLAKIVSDQEKIYIPSVTEVNNGIFIQNQRTLDYMLPTTDIASNAPADNIINLNSATIEELDQLPGIGLVTANKVIVNRPYLTVDELLTKKVVNKAVFEKIKSLISI